MPTAGESSTVAMTENELSTVTMSESEKEEDGNIDVEGGVSPFAPNKVLQRSPVKNVDATGDAHNATPAGSDFLDGSNVENSIDKVNVEARQCAFLKLMYSKELITSSPGTKNRRRLNSVPSDTEDIVSGKRKNELTPEQESNKKGKTNARVVLIDLEEKLMVLARQIQEQPTVKRETKLQMKFVSDSLAKFRREYDKEIAARDTLMNLPQITAAKEVSEFCERISAANDLTDITCLSQQRWPNGCFKRTKVNNKFKGFEDESVLHSLILAPNNILSDVNYKALQKKVPAVQAITEDKLRELGFINVCQEEATEIAGVNENTRRRIQIVVAGAMISDTAASVDTADVMRWADKLKEIAEKTDKNKIAIAFPANEDLDRIRKIFECRFTDTATEVHLIPNDRTKSTRNASDGEAIIIEGTSESYADILKNMKQNIAPAEMGVHVKKIQQTRAGAIRMVVSESIKGGRENLMKKIRTTLTDKTTVRTSTKQQGIDIFDIEEDVTESEVKEVIASELGVAEDNIRTTAFRALRWGKRVITVFLPKSAAIKAIEKRRIKFGWTYGHIKEKRQPDFCGKCQCFKLSTGKITDQVIPKQEIFSGVFIASAIVNPRCCYLKILNTNSRRVDVPKILKLKSTELSDFNVVNINQTI